MLPMRRVLQMAAPATLLGIFGVWLVVTPPSGRSNGTVRSGVESSLLNERRGVAPTMNPATRRALETAVNRQLDALGKGDYQAALRYAYGQFPRAITPAVRRIDPVSSFAMLAVKKATFAQARHTSEMAEMTVILEGTDGGGSDSSSSGTRTQYIYIFPARAGVAHHRGCAAISRQAVAVRRGASPPGRNDKRFHGGNNHQQERRMKQRTTFWITLAAGAAGAVLAGCHNLEAAVQNPPATWTYKNDSPFVHAGYLAAPRPPRMRAAVRPRPPSTVPRPLSTCAPAGHGHGAAPAEHELRPSPPQAQGGERTRPAGNGKAGASDAPSGAQMCPGAGPHRRNRALSTPRCCRKTSRWELPPARFPPLAINPVT